MYNKNRRYKHLILFCGCLLLGPLCRGQQPSYPIDSKVVTTVERTVNPIAVPATSPKLLPTDIALYAKYGYGRWRYGEGQPYQKRLDLMPSDYVPSKANKQKNLLHFFAITDIHITDKESPAQAPFFGYKGGVAAAYTPSMLYTTQFLDATIQTINALQKQEKFDFGISLGDVVNNAQYNELRAYIDVLDGKKINPDSGEKDDPIAGKLNDYQDEFQAAGLDKTIPWYQTMGNHDHLWMGSNPVDAYLKKAYVSDTILNMGNIFTDTLGIRSRGYYMGAIDGRTVYGDVIGAGPVQNFATPPTIPAADLNRRAQTGAQWMSQFFNSTTLPLGHGFQAADTTSGFACYTFEPKSDLPLRVIVVDDTQRDDDPDIHGYGHGSLDKRRYEWLVGELDKGQAEGKLMVIAAHIPIGVDYGSPQMNVFMGWSTVAAVTEKNLIAKLHTYPNLILWMSGHRHINAVTAFKSPDLAHPELGFWEVETSSLRDFPQQFRDFDIIRNSDNTISIRCIDIDPALKDGTLTAISRSYAIATEEIFSKTSAPTSSGSYNAELLKQISLEMQKEIKDYK
jgi:metallophosphoesterase (TIGR03768 family)